MIKQEVNPLIAKSIMRPTEVFSAPTGPKWVIQPKLNGVFARWDPDTKAFYSKRGIKFKQHLIPDLYMSYRQISMPLDGEIWAPSLTLQQITGALSHERDEPADYNARLLHVVFDAPDYTHTQDYETRMDRVPVGLANIHENKCLGLADPQIDGTIYRYLPGTYERGPSGNVLKVKFWKDIDVPVVGVTLATAGSLNDGALGALICTLPNGTAFAVGSGYSLEERLEFIEHPPRSIKARYLALSPDGVPLNPSYMGLDL